MAACTILKTLKQALSEPIEGNAVSARILWVGYSGGVDSTVLLHALAQLRSDQQQGQVDPFQVRALHVHHGLDVRADAWAQHCQQMCRHWAIACTVLRVDARSDVGQSPEAAAREARYRACASRLTDETHRWVVAHHEDDQAETVLLQLLRGAGVRGLAGMPMFARLGKGWLWRPLLGVRREAILAYATQHGLRWVEDPSNRDVRVARSLIRGEILPRLCRHWPATTRVLARSARHCAEAQHLLDAQAQRDVIALTDFKTKRLSCAALLALDVTRQRAVLRYVLHRDGMPAPSTVKLDQMIKTVLQSKPSANPCVAWDGYEIRRHRDLLWIIPALPVLPEAWCPYTCDWVLKEGACLTLPTPRGILRWHGPLAAAWRGRMLQVRFRQKGERCYVLGQGAHRRCLKKQLQAWDVPPWMRQRIALLYDGAHLVAVANYYTAPTLGGGVLHQVFA